MAFVSFDQHEIAVSLVYFGAPKSGCATNVRQLHRAQPARAKVELERISGKSQAERSWHFRYEPNESVELGDFRLMIRVASVPGGQDISIPRHGMMSGVDAVVFVADARRHRGEDNIAAMLDLEAHLAKQGLDFGSIPILIQVNHTDEEGALPIDKVVESLNPHALPVVEAAARSGKGVLETHRQILAATMTRLRDNLAAQEIAMSLTGRSRASREQDEDVILAHVAEIEATTEIEPDVTETTAELHIHPEELRGALPVQLVRSELRHEHIRIDAIVKRADDARRKLTLVVHAGDAVDPIDEETKTRTLQRALAVPPTDPQERGQVPPLWYGVGGLTAGVTSGILLGFLIFG